MFKPTPPQHMTASTYRQQYNIDAAISVRGTVFQDETHRKVMDFIDSIQYASYPYMDIPVWHLMATSQELKTITKAEYKKMYSSFRQYCSQSNQD